MENKAVLGILMAALVIGLVILGALIVNKNGGLTESQVREILREEVSNIKIELPPIPEQTSEAPVVPTAAEIAAEISVENADNVLLNEFLEEEFEEDYKAIEDNATFYAFEELENHDYRVIVKYLKTLLAEGEELDEDSIQIENEDLDKIEIGDLGDVDVDVKVTKLGLGDEEDKSARVTFEIEVKYKLEEGIDEVHKKNFVVIYDVLFEEGEWNDEEVELVSII